VVTGTNCGALSAIPAGTGGFGIGPGCVPQTNSNGAGWVNVGAATSLAWSGNTNPTGNLALSMGANTSTFTIGDLGSGVPSVIFTANSNGPVSLDQTVNLLATSGSANSSRHTSFAA